MNNSLLPIIDYSSLGGVTTQKQIERIKRESKLYETNRNKQQEKHKWIPGALIIAIVYYQTQNILGIIFGVAIVAIFYVSNAYARRQKLIKRTKLMHFAETNKFLFSIDVAPHNERAIIFGGGKERKINEQFIISDKLRMGTFSCVSGDGRERKMHNYFFTELTLSRPLPHIIFDSKETNLYGLSSLPETQTALKKMQLESGLQEFYKVYVADNYDMTNVDVPILSILAIAINHSRPYDFEFVDNKVYLYQPWHVDLSDESNLRNALEIAEKLYNRIELHIENTTNEMVVDRKIDASAVARHVIEKNISKRFVVTVSMLLVLVFIVSALYNR